MLCHFDAKLLFWGDSEQNEIFTDRRFGPGISSSWIWEVLFLILSPLVLIWVQALDSKDQDKKWTPPTTWTETRASKVQNGLDRGLKIGTVLGQNLIVDTLSISKYFHLLTLQIICYRFSFYWKSCHQKTQKWFILSIFHRFNSRVFSTNKLCLKISAFFEPKFSIFSTKNCKKASWIRRKSQKLCRSLSSLARTPSLRSISAKIAQKSKFSRRLGYLGIDKKSHNG